MHLEFPPPLPPIADGQRKGRVPKEGYERGWSLNFTQLPQQIRRDPVFQRAIALARGRAVASELRLMNLFLLIRYYLPRLEGGHIVEFGSYRGGSAFFMAAVAQEYLPAVRVYGLDTFSGMPASDKAVDLHTAGNFRNVSLAEVEDAAAAAGLVNLKLVQGLFEDTGPQVMREAGRVALVHIDCDIYPSIVTAWEASKPALVRGGYVVFDDATAASCLGATEAVEEIVIQRDGLLSEQIYPHFVFRFPPP